MFGIKLWFYLMHLIVKYRILFNIKKNDIFDFYLFLAFWNFYRSHFLSFFAFVALASSSAMEFIISSVNADPDSRRCWLEDWASGGCGAFPWCHVVYGVQITGGSEVRRRSFCGREGPPVPGVHLSLVREEDQGTTLLRIYSLSISSRSIYSLSIFLKHLFSKHLFSKHLLSTHLFSKHLFLKHLFSKHLLEASIL